jgi:short-subunit dehydrogenase
MYERALVTGASSGLGRGLALALARTGTHVVCVARRKDELDALVGEIRDGGGSAEALVLDCADADRAHDTIAALDSKTPLDLVIANAGRGGRTYARELDWSTVHKVLQLNVIGAAATLSAVLPAMVARDRGHLVGISSLAGFRGLPKSAAYSSSKAALRVFLEGLRIDLRGTNVHVTTLCPGYVKTPATENRPYRTPFIMELDDAVEAMMGAIERKDPFFAFPRPLSTLTSSLPAWPRPLYEWIVGRTKVRG